MHLFVCGLLIWCTLYIDFRKPVVRVASAAQSSSRQTGFGYGAPYKDALPRSQSFQDVRATVERKLRTARELDSEGRRHNRVSIGLSGEHPAFINASRWKQWRADPEAVITSELVEKNFAQAVEPREEKAPAPAQAPATAQALAPAQTLVSDSAAGLGKHRLAGDSIEIFDVSFDPSRAWKLSIVALRCIATAVVTAFVGFLLARFDVINSNGKRFLASIAMNCTTPALLFTRILYCPQCALIDPATGSLVRPLGCHVCEPAMEKLREGWVLLACPCFVMFFGALLGKGVELLTSCPSDFKGGCAAAVAVGNTISIPFVLLFAIEEQFRSIPGSPLGKTDPVLYLSVYLIVNNCLQWSVGGYLLELKTLEDENVDGASCPHVAWRTVKLIVKNLLVPPCMCAIAGFLLDLSPESSLLVDRKNQDGGAPLGWLYHGIYRLGDAAVPVNLLVLGASVVNGPNFTALPAKTAVGIIISRMVLLPAIMSVVVYVFARAANMFNPVVWLVVLVEATTPTGSVANVMVQLSGKNKDAMATAMFCEYVAAPLLLPITLTGILSLVTSAWYLPLQN